MGIFTPKGDPTPRDPVVLFQDGDCETRGTGAPRDQYGSDSGRTERVNVLVELGPGVHAPDVGTVAFLICPANGPVTVLAQDPVPRRIGQLVGADADAVVTVIRRTHQGIQAFVTHGSDGALYVSFSMSGGQSS